MKGRKGTAGLERLEAEGEAEHVEARAGPGRSHLAMALRSRAAMAYGFENALGVAGDEPRMRRIRAPMRSHAAPPRRAASRLTLALRLRAAKVTRFENGQTRGFLWRHPARSARFGTRRTVAVRE